MKLKVPLILVAILTVLMTVFVAKASAEPVEPPKGASISVVSEACETVTVRFSSNIGTGVPYFGEATVDGDYQNVEGSDWPLSDGLAEIEYSGVSDGSIAWSASMIWDDPDVDPNPLEASGNVAVEKCDDGKDKTNSPEYWEAYFSDYNARCWKHEGSSSAHGSVTNNGTAVTLNPFGDGWHGDGYVGLVVKGGSVDNGYGPGNALYTFPNSGVPYFAPLNNGGQQSEVSHWIVCKGDFPPPTTVPPTTVPPTTVPPTTVPPTTVPPTTVPPTTVPPTTVPPTTVPPTTEPPTTVPPTTEAPPPDGGVPVDGNSVPWQWPVGLVLTAVSGLAYLAFGRKPSEGSETIV